MQQLEPQNNPLRRPAPWQQRARVWGAQFNLLRWFSLASFFIIAAVALGLGYISTRFVVTESVERDALLTAQFVQAIGDAEMRHAGIERERAPWARCSTRARMAVFPMSSPSAHVGSPRTEFLDHVEHLPDILLATVYALDRTVIWSTRPGADRRAHSRTTTSWTSRSK
jgi:hypothetical protein